MPLKKILNIKTFVLLSIVILSSALVLGTCFSPYGSDMGNLTISVGDSSRAAINPGEENSFEHEIILIGPGGTQRQTLSGTGTARFTNLTPGTYTINIRAEGATPGNYTHFPSRMLRAYGIAIEEIRAGRTNNVYVDMLPATEVRNEAQFRQAIDLADEPRGEYIVIKNNMTVSTAPPQPLLPTAFAHILSQKIIIIAEDTVTVTSNDNFYVDTGGMLILGEIGMRGNITFFGNNVDSIIYCGDGTPGGSLITINNGIILRNADRAIINEGILIMNGGIITNNYIGGIENTGIFTMNGGDITGNGIAASGKRGGVFVSDGIFRMHGGTISGNTSDNDGGGVFVDTFGIFTKTGGTIYGNDEGSNNNYAVNEGHAVYVYQRKLSGFYYRENWFRDHSAGPNVHLNSDYAAYPEP